MILNWFFVPTLVVAFALMWAGFAANRRLASERVRLTVVCLSVVVSLPACVYVSPDLLPTPTPVWYYELRAVPGSEVLAAGTGVLLGWLAGWPQKIRAPVVALAAFTVLWIVMAPYMDNILEPVRAADLKDHWDGTAFRQTTKASCAAASAATLLRHMGVDATESEVARRAYTSGAGTYTWYLMRAIRSYGVSCRVVTGDTTIPVPSLMSVSIGGEDGYGHMMPVLEKRGELYVLPDYPNGLSLSELRRRHHVQDRFLVLRKP